MINKTNNIIYSIYTDCEGKVKGRVKYCSDPPPRALTFSPSHGPFKFVLSSSALLYSTPLCPALPCPALPCPALPCLALPCPALPCLALPCPALPCLALPCPALPCPALPCLALLCCVLFISSKVPYLHLSHFVLFLLSVMCHSSHISIFFSFLSYRLYSLLISREKSFHNRSYHNFIFSFLYLNFSTVRTVGLSILMLKKEGKDRDIPDLPPNFTLKKSFLLNKEVRACIRTYS